MANRLSNPAPQHFTQDGNPLSGGMLFFYQPGATTTPKNTYSDIGLSQPNTHPVILSSGGLEPNIFLDGAYCVVLQDKNGVQQWVRDNVNADSGSPFGDWLPTVSYGIGGRNIVQGSDGNYYISIATPNIGNDPTDQPSAFWQIFIDNQLEEQTAVPDGEIAMGDADTGLTGIPQGANGLYLQSLGPGNGYQYAIATSAVIREARTANIEIASSDNSKLIDITANTFTQTFALAATFFNGWFIYLRNSGTGDITLDPSGGELIDGLTSYIMYPGECRLIQCNGATFTSIVVSPFNKTFITSGNFIKPPGYIAFGGLLWGAGGGGATAPGGGGGGGACVPINVLASALSASNAYVQGAGGATGNPGAVGGSSTFAGITSYGGSGGTQTVTGGSGGGSFYPGTTPSSEGSLTAAFGGGTGADTVNAGVPSVYGGAGGGDSLNEIGAISIFGGGGGAGPGGLGGISNFGGNGGNAGIAGAAPSGGGGEGAAGADGQLRIWGCA